MSIKFNKDFSDVKLVLSTDSGLANPIYSNSFSTSNQIAKIKVTNLLSNTKYYYAVSVSDIIQNKGKGSFTTFPDPLTAKSFTCAFASCANTGSTHTVFTTIKDLNPLFFINMGDLHYADIATNDKILYHNAYNSVFSSSTQSALYKEVPLMYMWDDHDYGANDADGTSPSREAACLTYRERVPHYTLPAGTGANPVYQSFVCGRVRFIMTDLMSMKTPKGNADNSSKTMMGETQIQWFFNELLQPEPFKVWVNTKPWIGTAAQTDDSWMGYSTERTRIANFIKENGLTGKVAILSGDMHGLAIDDGTNSDYATGGGAPIPVFQAAALDRTESIKGGSWSHGSYLNGTLGNQFGIMNVTDTGGNTISVEWLAKRGTETMTSLAFTVDVPSELPLSNVTNLQSSNLAETSVTLTWTGVADAISYDIEKDSVFLANTTNTTYNITGLTSSTSYNFNVRAKNDMETAMGTSINVTTMSPPSYLYFNGVSNGAATHKITTPSINYDEVVVEASYIQKTSLNQAYLQYGGGTGYLRRNSSNNENWSAITAVYMNGVQRTSGTSFIPNNQRVTLRLIKPAGIVATTLFSYADNTSPMEGNLYNIKFYLSGTLVAHYDMSTKTLVDQTGNYGSVIVPVGVTWVN